ncbi:MAG TPA: hypothetical protein VMV46_19445 [Thermoanaerobaculia bacterium]|nr:hypothetical protein [Thermoanaerobaculia bacterium]
MIPAALALLSSAAGGSVAQDHGPHAGAALGVVEFPISCSAPARGEFERAVALLHHMTYPQARQAFEGVAELDPECAMAHWGVAMTLFQPLWPNRPGVEELERGWAAVEKARALEAPSERERSLVDAAGAFFRDPASGDYWTRIRRWERAMAEVHAAFPEDPEVAAFYALARLAAAPSDEPAADRARHAAELLLAVHRSNPEHPGAMHYLVHANDAPGRERESLEVTRKYERVAPRNPHALHMPTHIYTRLGDWPAVIRGNLLAAEAALEHPAGERGELVWDELPHALEYLVYAYLQQGADESAAAQLERLRRTKALEPTFKTAFHLASIPARYALERRDWSEAEALRPRQPPVVDWDRFPWPEGVAWFARGLGAARRGDAAGARAAAERIGELEAAARGIGEDRWARNLEILGLELGGWLAQVEGDARGAVDRMRRAVELELATPKDPVTPAPTLPAPELLGDLLLEQGDASGALAAYRQALELHPNRFNSLLGVARAARATGDAEAVSAYRALLEIAAGSTRTAILEEARSFTSAAR